MSNIEECLKHIQCDYHKQPIIFINRDGFATPEERCWCKKCQIKQPENIEKVFQMLDILAPKQELLQGLFNKVNNEWMNLKQKIMSTIELIFQSYDQQLQQLNYMMGSINKYLNYREFIHSFTLDDLQKIGHLLYREYEKSNQQTQANNGQYSAADLYQIPFIKQQLLDQFTKIKTNLILAFEDLKSHLLQQGLKTESKIMRNPNPRPQDSQVKNQTNQQITSQQNRVIPNGKPPQPKSVIIGSGIIYEKKCDMKVDGLINCICLNSSGTLLIKGLYPNQPGDSNVAVKQIDSYAKLKDCSKYICGKGEITSIAFNESANILITADSELSIQCWESFDTAKWQQTQTIKAHDARITKLLISNKDQLFSASEDKVIKCWAYQNKYVEQYTLYVPTTFESLQINSQGNHLAALSKNEILLWENQNALTPITAAQLSCFCFLGDRILVGTFSSTVQPFQLDGNQYKSVNAPKEMNLGEIKQILFSDAQRQILIRTDKKIIIYLYTYSNLMMAQQEITGFYDQAYLQSGKLFSHILLYEEQETKIHYYAYKK